MRPGIIKDVDDSELCLYVHIKLTWLYWSTDICFCFCFFSISLFVLVFLEMLLNSD